MGGGAGGEKPDVAMDAVEGAVRGHLFGQAPLDQVVDDLVEAGRVDVAEEPPVHGEARCLAAQRQALGVLDAVFLGEPGVLEARQRITLRMRSAQRA